MDTEKRSEVRQKAKRCHHAEIRLVGVPVYEVKLKDQSTKGSCILVKEDSLLINHLKTGQNITVKYYLEDRFKPGKLFELAGAIHALGGNIVGMGAIQGGSTSTRLLILKVADVKKGALQEAMQPLVEKIVDLREEKDAL